MDATLLADVAMGTLNGEGGLNLIFVGGGPVPRKIRELKADLRRAGFYEEPGKGSHSGWRHPLLADKLTLSGGDGDDARAYQERQVRDYLRRARETVRREDA